MNKIFIMFLILVLSLMAGCSTLQIKDDTELTPLGEIAARRIGHQVALKDPAKVTYLIEKCDEILNAATDIDAAKPLLMAALRYAADKYTGDPLIADDLISILKYYRINIANPVIDLDSGEVRTLMAFIRAFRAGLKV
jgi:hypothetical protein